MKTVFEPSNALEGHMLQDLLKQRGIEARLDGAQLQGGVGELPVSGFVRLVVSDEDFAAARAVIDEWEATSVPDPIAAPPGGFPKVLLGTLVGLIVGAAASYAFFRAPVPAEGIDHDGDGSLDERWFATPGGAPIRTEVDRNFDGRVDWIYRYDPPGKLDSANGDDDFNGTFETAWSYVRGNPAYAEIDLDGDSAPDLVLRLIGGVLDSAEYFEPGNARPVRRERFELSRITSAEVDTDRDGHLDTRFAYSAVGEIINTARIAAPD
jgi:hypothetical protein